MKYFTIGIIVVALVIVVTIWLKKAPDSPVIDQQNQISTVVLDKQKTEPVDNKDQQPLKENKVIMKNGMKIEITKEGTGVEITSGQTAVVDYVGKLTDGSVFDASRNHGTTGFSFSLGAGDVIKGWDEGVVGMKVGEVRMLTIPPELGYGLKGYPPVIPASATLTFEVTLLAIK